MTTEDWNRLQFVNEDGSPFSVDDLGPIDFGATGLKEIAQNVKIILTTPIWSVPLDRLFGMDFSFIDEPNPTVVQNTIMVEVLQQLGTYEPRVQALGISYESDPLSGHLIPSVQIRRVADLPLTQRGFLAGRRATTPWR
jgi:uncharacterized protein